MTVPFWCLFAAAILPYAFGFVATFQRQRQFGAIDNKYPRLQQTRLEGLGARAQAASANAFEALPVFAAAVLVAHLAGVEPGRAALLSGVFVAARVLHGVFYLANLDILRSAVWFVGFACCVALFLSAP